MTQALALQAPFAGRTYRLTRCRKPRLCAVCYQLILPGELYIRQRFAPWEQEDGDSWWDQSGCRWCVERFWRFCQAVDVEEDLREPFPWNTDYATEWYAAERLRWVGEQRWIGNSNTFAQSLRVIQKRDRAVLRWCRRCPHIPTDLNLVAYLQECGFKPGMEGGLDHMLTCGQIPGLEWWRCGTCNQHPCDCACEGPV